MTSEMLNHIRLFGVSVPLLYLCSLLADLYVNMYVAWMSAKAPAVATSGSDSDAAAVWTCGRKTIQNDYKSKK